jgi:hypothetical protein
MALITPTRGYLRRTSTSVTFTGASTLGLAGTNTTWFTTTGEVLVLYLVPFTVATLTVSGAATLTLGVTNSTGLFIAATVASALATGEFWTEATAAGTAEAGSYLPAAGVAAPQLKDVAISANILSAVAAFDITGGTLRMDAYWLPLSSNGGLA